ncbi:ABC transporter permease subunit [Paenibacillus polymyxa]|uniref:ABC transporter permease n=2 Tax=Paenibacillus polymyxa TaxID=1406 RepID=UPI0002D27A56|nr:ABC transporter permease [Paenibacillus polymyxa]MBE7899622.1 ABC transporter permease [Paenibacillus polymyxa]MCC3258806.1 ABC transporter permease [Paenibacillus polymyxa]QPK52950.1 ABC transporter permease subunit [Paenibacillus polymyxa]QPK58029.1 ABC transporter permease subunit [Paenibacillus polymyxa]UOD86460.1 ABC transporter permease [Paenibacillus polymyxa ATCC 842]
MKLLVYSEFERLWRRKWFWLMVLCTPMLACSTGVYFLRTMKIPVEVLSLNFVVTGLRENLFLACNIAVAVLAAAVYTEEFRSGQLRLLFMRRFTRGQIFWGKLLVLNTSILLLLMAFAVSSQVIVEVWTLSYDISDAGLSGSQGLQMLEYYGWALASLLAISSFYCFVAMYSKSVTYAIGFCMVYNLGSLLFDSLYLKLAALVSHIPYLYNVIAFMIVPYMQHTGLDRSLMGNLSVNRAIITVVSLYLIFFTWGAYRRFVTDDYLY